MQSIQKKQSNRRTVLALAAMTGVLVTLKLQRGHGYDIKEVSLSEGHAMQSDGALVIDARSADAFEYRHIVGAMLLPLAALRVGIPEALAYAKSLPILVYCGDGLTIGPEATALLNKAGFAGAVNLRDGIEGWDSAGFPVERKA